MRPQRDGCLEVGGERYREIFAGVSHRETLRCAIARAVGELRAAMEKEANPAVTMAHMRNLDDLNPETLAMAYALAEQTCIYWPSPGQIREMAGGSPEELAAKALDRALVHIESYGLDGREQRAAVSFGDDGTGRRVLLAAEPHLPAPKLPHEILETVIALGNGSVKHGMLYLHQHPRLRGWEDSGGEAAAKAAERVERQWARCYRQILRDQQRVHTTSGRAN